LASIRVVNNGTSSNTVTLYTNASAPGVFTLAASGTGPAAVLHADFSVVNQNNPAKKGETVLVFLTGLGAVDPAVADGAAGPSNPPSKVKGDVTVFIDDQSAPVSFAGLAPGFAGLYQLNVQIPAKAGSGDVYIEVDTLEADTIHATINVAP
jgi:uncharacterized protein (TIGR03437 family)